MKGIIMVQKAGDPVQVVEYDPTWPSQFSALAYDLRAALGDVALRIDHIGSTSISGLAAKPIIDIQISVASFDPLESFKLPLEQLGYLYRADNPERTKRYFREPLGTRRIHIHVRRCGSFSEQFALLFRDYLRAHPDRRDEYAQLKRELAQRYVNVEDRAAYTDAKAPFIWETISRADRWAQHTGWLPAPSDA
jgi:GrpB-like predicted nucleotidyltransferase (UPF0157 family)